MKKTFLFDLDGTLVDSASDIAKACQSMLSSLNRPALDTDRITSFVGKGMDVLIQRCLNNHHDHLDVDPVLFAQAKTYFLESYHRENGKQSRCYPHVRETLTQLHAQGHTLGIVTNKPQCFTLPLLEALSLHTFFKVVVCGDTCEHKKPHPEPIHYALQQLQQSTEHTLFVGDSENDILASKACQIPVALMTYGYNEGKSLQDLSPEFTLDNVQDILNIRHF